MVLSLDTIKEPVGSIKHWLRASISMSVPYGWLVCDGSLVSDPLSPFNGTTIPDLRSRYLKGHSTGTNSSLPAAGNAGIETGGAVSVNLNHNHGIGSDGNHSHGGATLNSSPGTDAQGNHAHTLLAIGNVLSGAGGHQNVTDNAGNHSHTVNAHNHSINGDGSHSHGGGTGGALGSISMDPVFSGFVYIIKYK